MATMQTEVYAILQSQAGFEMLNLSRPYLLKTDGSFEEINPANGVDFKFQELCSKIGCGIIEVAYPSVDNGFILIIDEEGKLVSEYGYYPLDVICGDCVVCPSEMLK